MDDPQMEQFKVKLLALRAQLQAMHDMSKEATKPVELDQASIGRLSRMDAMQAQEMAQEAARRRQQQLTKVDAALRRIDSGDYGFCFVCGEEIDPRRLTADPTHTRCIGCADKRE